MRLVGMLIVILDDAGWDLAGAILLAAPLGVCRVADHRHRGAGAVVYQVRGRGHAGEAAVRVQRVVVVTHLTTLARSNPAVLVLRHKLTRVLVVLGVLCQVQALNGGSALLADAADDVRDGVGLVAEVAVGNVGDAQTRETLLASAHAEEVLLQFGVHVLHDRLGGDGLLGADAGLSGRGRRLSLGFSRVIEFLGDRVLSQVTKLGRAANRANNVLHVVRLAADEAAEVQDHILGLVALAGERGVGVLQGGEFLLVALALALEFLGDLLLENEGLEGIVALLLGARQAEGETGKVVLLLVNETRQAAVLALVGLDLDLELRGLLGELLSKGLELEELLLPGLELLDQEVVPLGNLAQLRVHASLQVDIILPGLHGIARVLVALTDNLVEVAHRDLGHERLLDGAAKEGLHTGVASELLADMVHDAHDSILVPPWRVLDTLDLSSHDNDLTGGNELTTGVSRPEVVGDTSGRDITVQSLGQAVDELGALARVQDSGRARGEHKVAVQVDNQSIGGRVEQAAALSGNTQDVRAGFLHEILDVTGVHDRHVQTTPLVDSHTVTDSLSSRSQDGGIVADENNPAGRRHSSLDNTHDVGDGQAGEQRPHGEVLESCRRRRELVAQGVVLHIDPDQIVQTRCREAQDARDLLGVEEVGGLVPVNPHSPEVVTQQVVQRVAGEEAQAVGNPVGLLGVVVEIRLSLLAQLPDGLSTLLVRARPDTQANTVQRVGRVLLQDEGMVSTVRLGFTGADFHVVREACLSLLIPPPHTHTYSLDRYELTLIAECSALAISLSCSNLGLLPRISGSQNWPTAPFI